MLMTMQSFMGRMSSRSTKNGIVLFSEKKGFCVRHYI